VFTINRFPVTVEDINLLMEIVYLYVFQAMTQSFYKYNKHNGTWGRDLGKPIFDVKDLLHHYLGAFIDLGEIVEEIRVLVP
jgi:hypothetical protein